MIYISELLPNPAGKDTEGEWIEICSAGNENESLYGWKVQNTKGKTFSLPDQTLQPYTYVTFDYSDTRLTLTNTGGTFYLLNQGGEIVDTAVYEGTYKDDVSAIRTNPTSAFVMSTTPTKGYANIHTQPEAVSKKVSKEISKIENIKISEQKIQEGVYKNDGYEQIIFSGILIAGILSLLFLYACRKMVLHTKGN